MREGQCHCGAIRYRTIGEPVFHALCHCADCRRHAGAPMVAWALFRAESVTILRGTPRIYASSASGRRHFCADCGTGLFYTNAGLLPNLTDVQSVTLDDPNSLPPRVHIHTADRLDWMRDAHALPAFERLQPR